MDSKASNDYEMLEDNEGKGFSKDHRVDRGGSVNMGSEIDSKSQNSDQEPKTGLGKVCWTLKAPIRFIMSKFAPGSM